MWNITPHCSLIIGCAIHKIFNQWARLHCTTEGTMKLTERTRIQKATALRQHRDKWQAAMLVSTLKATKGKKRTDNVRSNLHICQYAGSVCPDHSQGQALVESLAFPGVTRHINKFLCKTTQKRGSGFAIHTSGLNCHCLKVVNVLEVMESLVFCILSFCSCEISLSGSVLIVALSKCVHNCCITY